MTATSIPSNFGRKSERVFPGVGGCLKAGITHHHVEELVNRHGRGVEVFQPPWNPGDRTIILDDPKP